MKRLAHIVCNFKNIAKHIASRHQLHLCYQLMSGKSLQDKEDEIEPGSIILLASLDHSEDISVSLGRVPVFDNIFFANWCRYYGMKYRAGMMVVIDIDEDLELAFGNIVHVLADGQENIKLIVEKWETTIFNQHYHAYSEKHWFQHVALSYIQKIYWISAPPCDQILHTMENGLYVLAIKFEAKKGYVQFGEHYSLHLYPNCIAVKIGG